MAALTANELETYRRLASRHGTVTWRKPDINAALQAIEDAVVATSNVGARSFRAYISQAIEAAAPGQFTNPQKDDLFVLWCRLNVARGGLL